MTIFLDTNKYNKKNIFHHTNIADATFLENNSSDIFKAKTFSLVRLFLEKTITSDTSLQYQNITHRRVFFLDFNKTFSRGKIFLIT